MFTFYKLGCYYHCSQGYDENLNSTQKVQEYTSSIKYLKVLYIQPKICLHVMLFYVVCILVPLSSTVVVLFCGSSVQIWVMVLSSVLLEEGFPLVMPS